MAKIDLVKEYDEWKKKRDSRDYNYGYDNGGSSDDLVGEYNSWKKNYEASQQRVKPSAQLSQPSFSAPSPIMTATMKLNDPRSANYLDNLADTYAANAWYKRSPEAHASDARNYAATVGAAAKYSGMSYADRAAALEQLKINLKNMPSPEQGAEYQYLKDNLEQASPLDAAIYRAEQDVENQKRVKAHKDAEKGYADAYNELQSEYGNSPYWNLVQYRGQASSRGENDHVAQINGKINTYLRSIEGSREAELIKAVENYQTDISGVAEASARHNYYIRNQRDTDLAVGQLFNTENYDRTGEAIPFDEPYSMALRGMGKEPGDNSAENAYKFKKMFKDKFAVYDATADLKNKYPEYADTIDDVLNHTIASGTAPESYPGDDIYRNYMNENEWLMFYALLGKGTAQDTSSAFDYLKSLKHTLAARADAKLQEDIKKTIQNAPPVADAIISRLYEAGALVTGLVGAPLAGLDLLAQGSPKKDENGVPVYNYDPHTALSGLHNYSEAFRSGTSAAIQEDWGKVPAFLYDTLYSTTQSVLGATTAGPAFTFIMGSGAAASRAKELYFRGVPANNIISGAIAAGINEALFEYISLDKLVHPDTMKPRIQRLLTQAGIEGSEEVATDIANNIADKYLLGEDSDISIAKQNYLAEHPGASYDDAERYAWGEAVEKIVLSGVAGAISGGLSAVGYDIINKTAYVPFYSEQVESADPATYDDKGNVIPPEKASEYRREAAAAETVENAPKENGATDEKAADLAPLVSKSILGEELTDAEQAKIDNNTAAVRYMDEVGSKTSEISGSTKASDRLREGALDKVFETAMRNELKPAKLTDSEIGKANETSYKVSTTGKTTYNGKAVNIDAIDEIGDGNALVTLEGGETAKLSEIEFADKGEAVAWQTITSIDGITPKAASELIAQYKNKPANVTAGVWAHGIAEGYEIGRSGKLGTKEFPKAEAAAKYLSNIGNDARRISETVGRQDARYERHKEAIEVERKNVNNKNVTDVADTLDKMGRKYKIVEGIDGDGYIEKDGTIVLNKDAKDPIGFVLKHELTHYAETSKDYDGIVKAVKGSKAFATWIDKQSLKDGTQLQQEGDYIRRLKDRYRRHAVTLTNPEAHREMIANFVGDTLFNENGVGLDGLVNGMSAADRNAEMRFLTKIADFFRKRFTKKGERAYLEHFFNQLQNTATGERAEEKTYSIAETVERERAQSIKQIERLNETVTHLRDMLKLQRTLTHGAVMTQASVARQADRLMDRWDVYVGKGELTKLLNAFYTTVAQKVNQRALTWEEVADAAQPVVDFLLSKQVTETENDSVKNVVDYLKGKAIRLNDQQRAEIKHVYGSVTAWQKAIAGTVKLRNDGIALDSLWQEASELHPDWFDPDVTSDADMPIRLAETAKQLQDSLWMEQELPDEAWEETKRDILYDVYETFFDAAPIQTLADKQAKEMSELKAKAYAKIEQVKDAASARIQNLKEADRERYERLRRDKNAKIEEVKAEARERRLRERERRKKSQLRAEIKDRISEFNDKLLHPGKNKYVPMEFVRSVAGFLKDIDIGAKPGTKVSEKLAALKVKYDALKNDKYYSAAYNEQIGNLLQTVATEIGDTPLPKMSAYQLELLNNMLRALNHRIEHAVSVDRISKSKNAFEYARELINELNAVDRRAITGTTAGKLLDMQVRPQTMFERFAGFKKNSYWSQLYDALDSAQLRETQLSMEAQQMFSDLLNDRKNYKRLADSVDIGLTDGEGNPVLISRGMMLSIRRALMNADNTRHIVGGGFTIPDFDLYYKGKMGDAFNKKGKRVFGFAADMADIAHQIGELRETMAEQKAAGESTAETETKIADLESQFNELKDRSNAYAAQLAATIDDQLTMYEQNLLSMADVFFDEWSKDILNEATLSVYGFKKANVEKYFPIKVDNNYTETKFDTFSNDISLENAGFMKDRVMSSKPILLQDITDVISDQIKKVSRYAAYLEVLDDFNRIYNVTLPGSSDSVQDALTKRFAGEEGKKFIENLLQDIQGGRRGGSVTLFDKARGKLAAATLTLNARVALAQAASFPTAAAELGWAPIMKALGKTFKKTDKELIMKYSPLLAYRSWGFSSTEIGDARRIKDIRHKVDSKLRWLTGWITSVDSYTVGHLWYAAEYYVDANNKDLEKGSEKYYEEVAKVFNRTIEKTQPNYTTLQRPELMRTNNELVKQLSMFMTQRLQNVNILYEAFARYDKYKKDFKAGRNGVTREDVTEARKARTRAIVSQIIAAATISIIKNLTDMLLHSFKKRDDDDDYDLTDAEWNLLDAFCDSLISNVVLGSEAYSFLKSKITGDRYYGISLGGVGAITETVDDVSDFIDATKKAFAGSDMNWNAAKQLGYSISRLMGIPVQNAVKYVTAVSEWVQDAKADQFNHGNYVGKVGVRLYLAEGRTADAIKEINEQQAKGVDMQSTVRDYYKPMYLEAKKSGNKSLMSDIGKELDKIIKETGVYKKSADKVLSGWVTQAENDAKENSK